MKKFLAFLIVTLMLTVVLASCNLLPPTTTTPAHECEHACEECGKCLDAECAEDACAEKCEGHHECEDACEICGKCTSECAEPECADKCPKHYTLTLGEATVKVDGGKAVGTLPEVPAVAGKTGKWVVDGTELTPETVYSWAEDKTAEAVYTSITYTVTFKADGEVVDTKTYTVDNATVEAPAVPTKAHYTGAWESYTLTTGDVEVNAVYTAVEYTVTFKADGTVVDTKIYTVENATVEAPAVPEKVHYTGAWAAYELNGGNVEVNAVYTAVEYTVTFKADGEVVVTRTYTVDKKEITVPEVPAKTGHTGIWDEYELTGGNLEVNATYTANTYKIEFGTEHILVTYGQPVGTLPAVPEVEGKKNGKWMMNGAELTAETVYLVAGSSIATAEYEDVYYTVTFTCGDETKTVSVKHGEKVSAPEGPIVIGAYYVTDWTANSASYDFESAVKGDLALVAELALWDPSYGTQKNEFSYYISDFNNASVMMGITEAGWDNPWINDPYAPFTEHSTVTHGDYKLNKYTVTGLRLVQDVDAWTGFSYKMPTAFDLTKAATISVRVAYGSWNAHFANFYILVKSGDNMVNAIGFAKQYNTYEPNYNGVTPVELGVDKETGLSSTLNVNFMECWVEIDVAALMEATGFTTIDEIYFGQKNTGFQLTIDEIYYTVPHDCESVCEVCGKCLDAECTATSCVAKCECVEEESYDPSYLTQKGDKSYYISNFDNASVMEGVTQEHINPWGGTSAVTGNTVAQGSYTNGHGTFTGITFQQPSDAGTYGSFNYALPSAFDLSQAKTIVVRIAANAWSGGYFNSYIMLKSGTTYVNVNSYAKIYRGASMNGVTPDALSGSVISGSVGNYLTAYIEIDVAALMEDKGLTSIDGIVFGANSKTFTHAIDEIYYTVE